MVNPNPLFVGADTPVGLTQGSKGNGPLPSTSMLSDLKAMGINWLRWQPYAYSIELTKGVYTWGNLDTVVAQCNAAGINLYLTVLFPPPWGLFTGWGGTVVPTPAWTLAFASAMCQRYDGAHGHGIIQCIDLGNEDYAQGDDPVDLVNTMNLCYPVLKSAYPNLTIGHGAAIHRNRVLTQTYYSTLWQGAAGHFDFLNYHYYTMNNNSGDPSVNGSTFMSFPNMLSILQNSASAAGHPNFPIWITETGFPINCNGGTLAQYVVSMQVQWNYLKYELDQIQALGQPAKLFIYTLSYLNTTPTCGVGTSYSMSLYQGVHGTSGSFTTIAYQQMGSYPENWGGGSTTTTGSRDFSMRARLRTGTGTGVRDFAMRARVTSAGTGASRDFMMRVCLAGGIVDTFVRANQPQWGTASDGSDSWTQASGGGTASIVSNQGKLTGAIGVNTMRLGAQTLADVEASARFTVSASADIPGITLRDQGLTTFYRLRVTAGQLQLTQNVSNVFTVLSTSAFSIAANTPYWFKFRVQGTTLYGKIWPDGSIEPAGWTTQVASSGVVGAGQVGLSVSLAGVADSVLFDHFSAVAALSSVGVPTTRTKDFALRARLVGRSTTQAQDFALRARLGDLATITTSSYAAKQPPLIRRFPKS